MKPKKRKFHAVDIVIFAFQHIKYVMEIVIAQMVVMRKTAKVSIVRKVEGTLFKKNRVYELNIKFSQTISYE